MKERGITLIALVITVIVLLILAGVAVSIGLNGDSLFAKADQAKAEWNEKVGQEKSINDYLAYLGEQSNEIKIIPTQNAGIISLELIIPGTKSISEATKEEKIDALYEVIMENNNSEISYTKMQLRNNIGAYNYYEWIERLIERYELFIPEDAETNDKLDALLSKLIDDGELTSGATRNDINEYIEELVDEGEEELARKLELYEITYIGEKANITVMLGNTEIPVGRKKFFAIQEGTYTIKATTDSGKIGETAITVDYGGLTPLIIGEMLLEELIPIRIREKSLLYDSNVIETWSDLIESEYNTLNLEEYYDELADQNIL